jgi:hypothetical protein
VAELQAKVLANQTQLDRAIAEAKRAVASAASDARVFGEGSPEATRSQARSQQGSPSKVAALSRRRWGELRQRWQTQQQSAVALGARDGGGPGRPDGGAPRAPHQSGARQQGHTSGRDGEHDEPESFDGEGVEVRIAPSFTAVPRMPSPTPVPMMTVQQEEEDTPITPPRGSAAPAELSTGAQTPLSHHKAPGLVGVPAATPSPAASPCVVYEFEVWLDGTLVPHVALGGRFSRMRSVHAEMQAAGCFKYAAAAAQVRHGPASLRYAMAIPALRHGIAAALPAAGWPSCTAMRARTDVTVRCTAAAMAHSCVGGHRLSPSLRNTACRTWSRIRTT